MKTPFYLELVIFKNYKQL
ncbi:hypothetical protein GMOD_00010352 [Pyrenophora seminiperda CCB06]|uniref:Uncharacterized protein n=1 Tax=Pyrenophora seminiperda CCB06 TaxID=1302712 RepID=A0A3M7M584_9PLEO|nr:hypothetical protein GMOD_00010352 [Pyrenophora seminiperda CCB06]